MFNIKAGSQTFSAAPQRTDFDPDRTQNISAKDKENLFQGEEIGDTLNKLTDPNWTDPAKKMRTVGNNQLGKDAFLNLLLTQLKNQDPTNPLKSHEMAAQLAQFTSLEKLQTINDGIEGLRADKKPDQNFQALSYIGHTITSDNSKISRSSNTSTHDIRFKLAADAQTLSVKIKNAQGADIRAFDLKGLKSGQNAIEWNGIQDDGQAAPAGDYVAVLEAVGSNGKKLMAETKLEGTITGVNFTPKGPQLLIGNQVVDMRDVKSISDPRAAAQGQMMPTGVLKAPAVTDPASKVKPQAGAKAKPVGDGNINDVAMDQGLINILNKQGAKAGMEGT